MEKVVTYDGTSAERKDCRYIKKDFYIVGDPKIKDSGQCYKIKNPETGKLMYYRINSGLITWDYEKKEYVLLKDDLVEGIVDSKGEVGYFTPNIYENVYIRTNCPLVHGTGSAQRSEKLCISDEVAEKYADFQSVLDGYYYKLDKKSFSPDDMSYSRNRHSDVSHRYAYQKELYKGIEQHYNLSDSSLTKEFKKLFDAFGLKPSQAALTIKKLLGSHTFGYEVETKSGRLPQKELYKYGIIPLKDGSISGHEYVSLPIDSEKGVESFLQAFELYRKFCRVDQMTSLHYHFGNVFNDISDNREFKLQFIALYMLYYHLQSEIWDIFPPYKKSNDYFKQKRDFKDHCQNLKSFSLFGNMIFKQGEVDDRELNKYFNILFRFLNDGNPADDYCNLKTRKHCKAGRNKWEVDSRYYNLNLYNVLFSNSKTVEFRASSGTCNIDKALPWLLICNAILHFAKNNYQEIIEHKVKYSISDVVEGYRNNFGGEVIDQNVLDALIDNINAFVSSRKEHFINAYLNKDIFSDEFSKDHNYMFPSKKNRLIHILNE